MTNIKDEVKEYFKMQLLVQRRVTVFNVQSEVLPSIGCTRVRGRVKRPVTIYRRGTDVGQCVQLFITGRETLLHCYCCARGELLYVFKEHGYSFLPLVLLPEPRRQTLN